MEEEFVFLKMEKECRWRCRKAIVISNSPRLIQIGSARSRWCVREMKGVGIVIIDRLESFSFPPFALPFLFGDDIFTLLFIFDII